MKEEARFYPSTNPKNEKDKKKNREKKRGIGKPFVNKRRRRKNDKMKLFVYWYVKN
jgi:hypothetical protein